MQPSAASLHALERGHSDSGLSLVSSPPDSGTIAAPNSFVEFAPVHPHTGSAVADALLARTSMRHVESIDACASVASIPTAAASTPVLPLSRSSRTLSAHTGGPSRRTSGTTLSAASVATVEGPAWIVERVNVRSKSSPHIRPSAALGTPSPNAKPKALAIDNTHLFSPEGRRRSNTVTASLARQIRRPSVLSVVSVLSENSGSGGSSPDRSLLSAEPLRPLSSRWVPIPPTRRASVLDAGCSWLSLPDELQLVIMGKMAWRERYRMALVAKAFHYFVFHPSLPLNTVAGTPPDTSAPRKAEAPMCADSPLVFLLCLFQG
jgi:hypothetical protein